MARAGQLLLVGVIAASGCLVAGLVLWLLGSTAANGLLNAGLIVLMAMPVLRVALSIAEYARVRDWLFVATACCVLAILVASIVYSTRV
jgi:uncharacterized membrane protein